MAEKDQLSKLVEAAPWGVWAIRWAISTATAGGIAFLVADYVVGANTASTNRTFDTLNASLQLLNETILENAAATRSLSDQMQELLRRSEVQSATLAQLDAKVSAVTGAVQDAGIDIRISSDASEDGKSIGLADFKRAVGVSDDAPIYLQIGPDAWPEQ
ncbi:hypothetical protein [Tropicibacter alexandrii]|uniref:hypothetical protein n=1 Tax=Tropicibacter alexandrii TaxID=2267683 RepID=UPI001008F445|nr:hypothetical protein [Tropicibacter alexandrii]